MAAAETEARYCDRQYWDARYESTGSTLFDWYQDYDGGLNALLQPLLTPKCRILHLGCGNSPLAERLHDAGFTDVTSVDYSLPCVEFMRARNAAARPSLRFEVADCTALRLAPATFDVVLEKGLLDSMVCAPGPSAAAGVRSMVDAVVDALVPGGVYILISFGAPGDRLQWIEPQARGLTTDIWTLAKPGAMQSMIDGDAISGDGDDALPQAPPPQRYSHGDGVDGKRHFVYIFTKAKGEPMSMTDSEHRISELCPDNTPRRRSCVTHAHS